MEIVFKKTLYIPCSNIVYSGISYNEIMNYFCDNIKIKQ